MYVTRQFASTARRTARLGYVGEATPVALAQSAPMRDRQIYIFTFQSLTVAPGESTLMARLRTVNTIEPRKIDRAMFSNQYEATFVYHGSGETVGTLGLRMQQALSLWYTFGSFQFQKAVGFETPAQPIAPADRGPEAEASALPKDAPAIPSLPTGTDWKRYAGPVTLGVFGLAGLFIATR